MPNPGLPSPSTYASGPVLTPELTGDVSNGVAWLNVPPQFIGMQTVAPPQSIPDTATTPVNLDTEYLDTAGGHRDNSNQAIYYGMYPGWYLVETFCPVDYTGTTGYVTAGVGGQIGGSSLTNRFGELAPFGNSFRAGSCGTHLVQMTNTGNYGGANNDYIQLVVSQTTGSSQNIYIEGSNPGRAPYMSLRWVGLPSSLGTANLPVPANPAWPTAPAYVTSAFLNANIRDTLNFLCYPPMFFGYYNASGSLASQNQTPAVGTAVFLGQTQIDNYNAYGTNTWTAPVGGFYYCFGQVGLVSGTSSQAIAAGLTVTSAAYGGTAVTLWGSSMLANNASSGTNAAIVRRQLRLNAGDTIQLAAFQNDSNNNGRSYLTNTSQWATKMIIVWMSA